MLSPRSVLREDAWPVLPIRRDLDAPCPLQDSHFSSPMHGTDGPFGFLDDGRVSNIENQIAGAGRAAVRRYSRHRGIDPGDRHRQTRQRWNRRIVGSQALRFSDASRDALCVASRGPSISGSRSTRRSAHRRIHRGSAMRHDRTDGQGAFRTPISRLRESLAKGADTEVGCHRPRACTPYTRRTPCADSQSCRLPPGHEGSLSSLA